MYKYEYTLACPLCGAPPDEANLEVVAGRFVCTKMRVHSDGFCFEDAKNCDTSDEIVECAACEQTFPLTGIVPYDSAEEKHDNICRICAYLKYCNPDNVNCNECVEAHDADCTLSEGEADE
jgi:hypothetical protein